MLKDRRAMGKRRTFNGVSPIDKKTQMMIDGFDWDALRLAIDDREKKLSDAIRTKRYYHACRFSSELAWMYARLYLLAKKKDEERECMDKNRLNMQMYSNASMGKGALAERYINDPDLYEAVAQVRKAREERLRRLT